MKDRDFLLSKAYPASHELDHQGAKDGGSRKITYQEAMDLAASDAATAVERILEHERRPRLEKRLPVRQGLLYHWSVVDQHGTVYAAGRTRTGWGGVRRAHRAYVAELTRQRLAAARSAGYAAEPACQHGWPFTGECTPCGRADS